MLGALDNSRDDGSIGDKFKQRSLGYQLSGGGAADAARDAADLQSQATLAGIQLQKDTLKKMFKRQQPFLEFGQSFIPSLQDLLTQEGQQNFLDNSPIFQASLDATNRSTAAQAAARGRSNSGGLVEALRGNYMSQAQPYLQSQIQNLFGAVNVGQNTAVGQANQAQGNTNSIVDLLTGGANAQAAGAIGAANAQQQGASNLAGLGTALFAAFSDRRLKRNAKKVGRANGLNVYEFEYNWSPEKFRGHMADEVKEKYPWAVGEAEGYEFVIYGGF